MKTLYTIALASLCLLTGVAIAHAEPATRAANAATTPLTFANAVFF